MTEFPPVCCDECGAFITGDLFRVGEDNRIFRWNGRSWEETERTFCKPCGHSVALAPSIERNPSALKHMLKIGGVALNGQA